MDSDDRPYHHGDLRAALLAAAEAELAEVGVEGFSLRKVARRAGVSHAAPAHHFGDVFVIQLERVAAEGYRRFLAKQGRHEAVAAPDAAAQLVAAGQGYVAFAMERPALFRLLFGSSRPDYDAPDLQAAAGAAYGHLVDQVTAAGGQTMTDVAAVWAIAHGLADLMAAGRLKPLAALDENARAEVVAQVMRRALP